MKKKARDVEKKTRDVKKKERAAKIKAPAAKKKERAPKKKARLKLGLSAMLVLFMIIPLVLSIATISVISLKTVRSNLKDGVEDTLSIVAHNLASYCKENDITVMNASNYYDYIDSLKDYGIEMAIIMEGVPGTTSIKNENNFRIREIELDKDIRADKELLLAGYYDEYVEIDGKVYYAYYVPLVENGEITAMAFAGELQGKVEEAANSVIVGILVAAVVLLVVIVIIALIFARSLAKSFAVLGKNVQALSEGNLSRQKGRKSSVKEISALFGAAGVMQNSLAETIGNVKSVAERLVGNISEVTELSDSNTKSAQQITVFMDELSASTAVMGDNVRDIQAQMMEIGNCVNDISVSVEQLYSSSDNILQTNDEAKSNMNVILENSEKSVEAVNDIAAQIRQTDDSITEIYNVVDLILNISEQTSLLSLNASIEAARAGAAGKGFAVVAEEIRKLSDQSADGAEMIRNLSKTITEKSQKSVELAERVRSLMLQEQKSVTVTQKKYEELSKDINQSVNEIKLIAEQTENLSGYKENVINNVQKLSKISEENAENSREVNANVGNIITEIQKVDDNCEKMNGIAKTLQESVSYFHE